MPLVIVLGGGEGKKRLEDHVKGMDRKHRHHVTRKLDAKEEKAKKKKEKAKKRRERAELEARGGNKENRAAIDPLVEDGFAYPYAKHNPDGPSLLTSKMDIPKADRKKSRKQRVAEAKARAVLEAAGGGSMDGPMLDARKNGLAWS